MNFTDNIKLKQKSLKFSLCIFAGLQPRKEQELWRKKVYYLHDLDYTFCFRNTSETTLRCSYTPKPQHPETQISGCGLPFAKAGEDSVQNTPR